MLFLELISEINGFYFATIQYIFILWVLFGALFLVLHQVVCAQHLQSDCKSKCSEVVIDQAESFG
ncbi:hypothetical protein DBZ36_19585 [Alginatibacterium sediminis]|uniref:Uncharacterized protein n=1 Tax=Alginatibacterium sediminis TaxID=2164068 RepID=A0A420E5X2_9ALTE|nr:hypothetical protein DBZ36_19585 [Alginatibacterium sediminis]